MGGLRWAYCGFRVITGVRVRVGVSVSVRVSRETKLRVLF